MTGRRSRRMRRAAAVAASAFVLAAALSGCSFAPDPAEVEGQARAVFDRIVDAVGASDPAVLRTLDVLPSAAQPCEEEGYAQTSHTARGTLSVTADPDAVDEILTRAEATFERTGFGVAAGAEPGERAWVSDDGVLVVLTDASPVLVVSVFTPCLAA